MDGVIIVGMVMAVPIVGIITDYKRKSMKLKAEMIREELELEI